MFRRRPVGRYLVSVCRTLPCQLRGSRELSEALCKRLDVPLGGTDATGMVTVEEVECLAACDGAPVVQVNTENYERLSGEQALELVERLLHDEVPPPTLAGDGAVTEPSTAALHWRLSGLGEPPGDMAERAAIGAGSGADGDRIGSAPAEGTEKQGDRERREPMVVFEVMTDKLDENWWSTYRLQLEDSFRQDRILIRVSEIRLL